eukprot:CAMPEP_0175850392 /NCGR_PEP_ID=MMETSP0107_2-20121207/25066_1 /TAXON_ID=195067 ORGANISM="Goniomonas pacifica, Strain CCMP1869" /NCGR_SAMPLE_ID=MMETSP0107_2 /ASSEMBLY_ACC=CAM_ASM_000203 /LENGTH=97 /DNA_ID=CAMNT_0017165679 /DNA_START=340 /DNA_END=630 /DNA_ORIENTATION=-
MTSSGPTGWPDLSLPPTHDPEAEAPPAVPPPPHAPPRVAPAVAPHGLCAAGISDTVRYVGAGDGEMEGSGLGENGGNRASTRRLSLRAFVPTPPLWL